MTGMKGLDASELARRLARRRWDNPQSSKRTGFSDPLKASAASKKAWEGRRAQAKTQKERDETGDPR